MPDWLRQRALISPDKVAVVCGASSINFARLDADADAIAARLHSEGVARGDRVALLAANSAEFAEAVFGVARAGAVLVPVNVRLTPREIAMQVEDCGAACIIGDSNMLSNLDLPESVRRIESRELVASATASPLTLKGGRPGEMVDLLDLHSIVYTSGTSGKPKGAMLSYGNFLWNAVGSAINLGSRADDRWLACMPLFHVGGLSILVRGVLYGMTVEIHEAFEPARANEALRRGDVTMVSLVATMLRRILEQHEGGFAPSLRCVLLGGGPIPRDLVEACLRRGIPVAQTYGLTEAASQVATLTPDEASRKAGSAGKPLLPTRLQIVRDDGMTCEPGEAGEIVVSGPTVTFGYWRSPEATSAAIRDGWLHTGDFGYLDEDGYLYVIDRREDLIVTGGENVYPAEVEAVLASHPAVVEAGVFGLSDPRWGQQVAAAVVLKPGTLATEEVLREHCRSLLAAFKEPKTIRFFDALPRTASGKLLRRELRDLAFVRRAAGSRNKEPEPGESGLRPGEPDTRRRGG